MGSAFDILVIMSNQTQWQTLSSKYVYENPWIKVRHDEFETPQGKRGIYGVVESKQFAMVIPKVDDKFCLVEMYRYPIDRLSIEFPAGGIDQGETSEEAVRRELQEETGLVAGSLKLLGHLYSMNGISDDGFDLYVANNCQQTDQQKLEKSEEGLRVFQVTEAELIELIASNKIIDSPTVAAFGLYREYLLRP